MNKWLLLLIGFTIVVPIPPAFAHSPKVVCPSDLELLTQLLIRDLPSYANRAIIKGRSRAQSQDLPHVVVASPAELDPIELPSASPSAKPNANLHQVFITTLERQRVGDRIVEFQEYHWIFLAKTRFGWRLTQSFSRIGRYPQEDKITASRESSQGAIAQGIKTWLRDCNANNIRSKSSIELSVEIAAL